MNTAILDYFIDPVLRSPTLGSMLMSLASSLIGVLVFVKKRSLLGEALSHATYPGVVLGVLIAPLFFIPSEEVISIAILIGAFFSSIIGLFLIDILEKKNLMKSDTALCFILSGFFGIGVLFASRLQFTHALFYKQVQVFLYGQTATMTDIHIVIYAILAFVSVLTIFILYRPIQLINFDRQYAKTIGIPVSLIDSCLFFLLVLAIIIGIRCVGIVLMSGMLIAPAAAARQWTNRLSIMFIIAAVIGIISGFLGNYLSVQLPFILSHNELGKGISLPTGPMILLSASVICMLSLLLSPNRGLFNRFFRILSFKNRCTMENILKFIWKKGEREVVSFSEILSWQRIPSFYLYLLLIRLRSLRWLEKMDIHSYRLTKSGFEKASQIVRLHRLWEVYLVDYLGQGAEKVHCNAEEMEHIINEDLEKELTYLLQNPKRDPHYQPIPEGGKK